MDLSGKHPNNLGYYTNAAATAYPDNIAMVDLSCEPPREVRYGELEERLSRFASLISGLGLKPGDRMAMAVGNRFEFVEIMYGAMRAGVVPVPLNIKLGKDTLAYIVQDAGCRAAVVEPGGNAFITEVVDEAKLPVRLAFDPAPSGWADYENALQGADPAFDPPTIPDDHPSFLPYTSGSTGRPKGVVLTHSGQLWWIRCLQRHWPSASEHSYLTAVPLYHKNAMAGAIKPFLYVGGCVVILPNFEPRRFLKTLSEYRCTGSGGVPAVFTLLLQEKNLLDSLDFSALQNLKIGSAPVQAELLTTVAKTFGVPVTESYGLTEGGPVMIGPPIDGRKAPPGSCGAIWPEGEIKLVDSEGNESETHGELWVKNPGVTPGYYNLPEVNKERLVDGWLRTGDLFSRDEEGFFFFRGRTDDMFNSGGENIYPKEVENLLLSHADVAEASVVPAAHDVKGHVPVAMVVLAKDAATTEEDLETFTIQNGPPYAHPRRIVFVDEMPLNGPGKIDRMIVQKRMEEILSGKAV